MLDTVAAPSGLAPFSLRDAPALIEKVFPAQKIGIEAQKERKAGAGQTLTALGSYWKGRKPLVLVRATVLASLLPATQNPEADLEIFDLLMRMDPEAMWLRKPEVTAADVAACPEVDQALKDEHIVAVPGPRGGEPTASWREDFLDELQQEAAELKAETKARLAEARKIADAGERQARTAAIRAAAEDGRADIEGRIEEESKRVIAVRTEMRRTAFFHMPFARQVRISERAEKIENLLSPEDPFYKGVWNRVSRHLGTKARSLPQLVEELGIARFGRRPVVGDRFSGGGSIPYEAARMGCDAIASDLNPAAAMLTWGALNIIGADVAERTRIAAAQRRIAAAVEREIASLGIEHDEHGNRAKVFLYCLETTDPQTGWRVPMAPSWVISANRACAARLVPDYARKRFDIIVESGLSPERMAEAGNGTIRDNHLVYRLAPVEGGEEIEYRIPMARLRGDGEGPVDSRTGERGNRLRRWEDGDVVPREPEWVEDAPPVVPGARPGAWVGGDILLERLFAIQWMMAEDIAEGRARPRTFFAAPGAEDLEREARVLRHVQDSLADWQSQGFVADMQIEPGAETARLLRERGWTHWHHLFTPRHLHMMALWRGQSRDGATVIGFTSVLDRISRLSRWAVGYAGRPGVAPSADQAQNVFYNQAFNTLYTHAARSSSSLADFADWDGEGAQVTGRGEVFVASAVDPGREADIWVYDPPYADAVHYHEITEYFIAWLRKAPPPEFSSWVWDSRRQLAIRGRDEEFRSGMVAAFSAMARNMPDNGIQVCMFTHKDAGVWADMAGIVWASGLKVSAAWYVSTETETDLRKGGYVQGTVMLVLRKRTGEADAWKNDVVPDVSARVAQQVATLTGLNQRAHASGRSENLFSDADIQMAGYAAALEVLTSYTHIEGTDMTREALRPRLERRRSRRAAPAETGIVEEMIDLAVQTANELMVPEGIPEAMWERMPPTSRFFLRMTATEAASASNKLSDYQNFAKAYRAEGWEDLMADQTANRARLKTAAEFRGALLRGHPFSEGPLRIVIYAIHMLARDAEQEADPDASGKAALHALRDHFGDAAWLGARESVRTLAAWLGRTWQRRNPNEASAARVLAALVASEKAWT
ncbi:anti-phage-associated DUF1156 domain-containing protein [Paracraurococcus lichenis]|uniref:DUF1156 domain-containing protein n=1 Tax=Paracraurococcus lichenis TaxID=3064888 RepID=A0ABT9EAE0_9PROT|nr:anti-phage-associated DUF1156 domain-containing protein [Paracraurococcus sp. LOR1-02]MDO9713170.1 DUF1156 domain-containing protein [Paracraurococcus sp. LOR1-02]